MNLNKIPKSPPHSQPLPATPRLQPKGEASPGIAAAQAQAPSIEPPAGPEPAGTEPAGPMPAPVDQLDQQPKQEVHAGIIAAQTEAPKTEPLSSRPAITEPAGRPASSGHLPLDASPLGPVDQLDQQPKQEVHAGIIAAQTEAPKTEPLSSRPAITEPAGRPASSGHLPLDASPLGPLPVTIFWSGAPGDSWTTLTNADVETWRWQALSKPLGTASTVSVQLDDKEDEDETEKLT